MMSRAAEISGKRKADAISPIRKSSSQLSAIANDKKRRINSRSDEFMTSVDEEDGQNSRILDKKEDEDDHNNDEYPDEDDEYIGPEETEVEQEEHILGDQKLTFKIYLVEDEDHQDEFTGWLQTIDVRCSYEGKEIGRGLGRYVQRDRIRNTFWEDMEEPSQELSTIAFELFDRYGYLKKEFKDHPIQKGTGAWGSELDLGAFLVIEDLLVDREWRRKTIGRKIITYLIGKSRVGSRDSQFSLVEPGWLYRDIKTDIEGKTKHEQQEIRFRAADEAESFFRSLEFRRIGASSCFGLATDTSHSARAILSADDFNPAEAEPDIDEDAEQGNFVDWGTDPNRTPRRLELLKNRLPLHHATIVLPDSECTEFLKGWKTCANPADEWAKLDRHSNNVLHVAACEFKVQTVRWLIKDSGEGQILSLARNVNGYTPIEELQDVLEKRRTRQARGMMTMDISDNFSGFAPEAIDCLAALRGWDNPSQAQYAQLKFGCTCGMCIDGFLSPRMCFALLCQAETAHDTLSKYVEDANMWTMVNSWIDNVALDIQQNFTTNKSYRQGFANLFHHTATTLHKKRSPTFRHLLNEYKEASEWPPHTKNFLQRGGKLDSVLRTISEYAKDQDECAGDGEHMRIFGDQVKALPECRNDHEFGCAALACDIPDLTRFYG